MSPRRGKEADVGAWLGELLGTVMADGVRAAGGYGAVLYLRSGEMLRTVVLCGIPGEINLPWRTLRIASQAPPTDAVREGKLVWTPSQTEFARLYPRHAVALPYPFALAAAPLDGRAALVLVWPGSRTENLTRGELEAIQDTCGQLANLLDMFGQDGTHALLSMPAPHEVSLGERAASAPEAGAHLVQRLPEGYLDLDLAGWVRFASPQAEPILGCEPGGLLGKTLWDCVPWLDRELVDRYWAAVISRRPTRFAGADETGRPITFELFPSDSGISVRITAGSDVSGASGVSDQNGMHERQALMPAGRLHHFIHLAISLTQTGGMNEVFELAADELLPAFDAQGLVMLLVRGNRLRVVGFRGYEEGTLRPFDNVPFTHAPTPAGLVLGGGVPSFIPSPDVMEELYPDIPRLTGKSAWAFLPLIITGRPIGVVVISYVQPHQFSPEERATLTALAGVLAQAVDRARLYDLSTNVAHELQLGLLPHELPRLPNLAVSARYLPATEGMQAGGDFYDLIRLDDTHAAAVIGDVQGHDIRAAAVMGQVRTAIHAYATAGSPPARVLAHTSQLLADLEPSLFASCLYAQLDLAGGQALLSNAGHPQPLLRSPGHPAHTLTTATGPLLGAQPGVPYPTTTISLPAHSTMLLYTDGLTEMPGVSSEQQTDLLVDAFGRGNGQSLEQLADRLLPRPQACQHRNDDIALLLLNITD